MSSVSQLFEELQELLGQDAEDQSPSQAPGLRRRVGSGARGEGPPGDGRCGRGAGPSRVSRAPLGCPVFRVFRVTSGAQAQGRHSGARGQPCSLSTPVSPSLKSRAVNLFSFTVTPSPRPFHGF